MNTSALAVVAPAGGFALATGAVSPARVRAAAAVRATGVVQVLGAIGGSFSTRGLGTTT
jgi:hypothetical protein